MGLRNFSVVEHIVPCQHVREHQEATAFGDDDELHLAIKQYIPSETAPSSSSGITIVAAHAAGVVKVYLTSAMSFGATLLSTRAGSLRTAMGCPAYSMQEEGAQHQVDLDS